MENILTYIQYGFQCIMIIGYILIFILYLIKRHKTATGSDATDITENISQVLALIEQAETLYKSSVFGESASSLKLSYVLDKLKLLALESGENFDLDATTTLINSIVSTTKNVNTDTISTVKNVI